LFLCLFFLVIKLALQLSTEVTADMM
jgi:hypothetical protein